MTPFFAKKLWSVIFRAYFHDNRRNYIPTAKAFRRRARGNPKRQKLSGGAIISNAGSHRSLRPATDAPRSFRVRCYHLSHPLTPFIRCSRNAPRASMPGGYFVTTVIIFLPLADSPVVRVTKISILSLADKTTRATAVGSRRKWRHARSAEKEAVGGIDVHRMFILKLLLSLYI